MKKLFLITVLLVPTILFGVREILQDKTERALYVNDLKYGVPKKRWEAAEILGDAGDCFAVPYLIEALKDEVPKVRENAAEALGKLGDRKALKSLKERLKDAYASVRYAAGESLARLRAKEGVSIIVQAIRDTTVSSHRRTGIAEALGILNELSAVSALISVIDDPVSPKLRESAIRALGSLRDKTAVGPLTRRLKADESAACRVAIAKALTNICDKANSIPFLVRALKDEDAEARKAVSEALDVLVDEDRNVLPILIELLEPDETREYATAALDSFFNKGDDIPLLAKVVGSVGEEKKAARLYAIQRLENINDRSSVPPLIEALEDADSIIRATAATALGKLGFDISVPALIEFVDDPSLMAAKCIIIALGDIADPRCDTTLFRLVKTPDKEWTVRMVTAQSLGKLEEKVVLKRLLRGLRDKDKDIRYLSAVSLGELKSKKALDPLDYTAVHDLNERTREAARIAAANTREKAFGRSY